VSPLFLRRSELLLVAVGLVLLAAIAVFSGIDWAGYRQDRAYVLTARRIAEDTNRILLSITEAEASQRAFLLTGKEDFLRPYLAVVNDMPGMLKDLDAETGDNADVNRRVGTLRAQVSAKLAALGEGVELKRNNDDEGVIRLVSSGRVAALTAALRSTGQEIRDSLLAPAEATAAQVRKNSDRSHFIISAGTVLLVILFALGTANMNRAAARREQLIATLETERRQASEVRDLLKTTFFSIGDGVLVTDRDGRVTYLNRVAEALTGWREQDAAGTHASKVFTLIDEATHEAVLSPVDVILSGGVPQSAGHTLLAGRQGFETPVEENASPITAPGGEVLGVVLVFRDITNRRTTERERERLLIEAEEARRDAERQRSHLHSLFLQAPASINIYRGPDHIFDLVHPLTRAFFGNRDLTGVSARTVHRPGVIEMLDAVYQSGSPRAVHEYPVSRRGVDGSQRDLYMNYFCCPWRDSDGSVAGVMTLGVDVTEQVAIKSAMRETEERLRETAKLESLGVLAGGIAHDFNNLLVGIIGNASLALEIVPTDSAAHGMIDGVLKAGERAAMLTRQMLAYSGRGRFVIEMVDVSALVAEMSPLLQSSIPRTVTLRTDLDPSLSPVEADSTQLQQIFMNLVINGAEACGERSGVVSIRTAPEEVNEERAGGFGLPPVEPGRYVALEVSDTGSGMDEETRSRIFDPFFTTKFTGRGLGLSAVLGIVRAHKGALEVWSERGRGATFRVLFPAAERDWTIETEQPEISASFGSGTVLIVDDEKMVRDMGRMALERFGYRVLEAENGRTGVALFQRYAAAVDLIILDLTMPVMSGEDTLAELRRVRPDIAIVLSTGFSETEARLRFQGCGLAGFLQKPYTALQLAEIVRAAVPA
jgi:PAS domain S-box-containing protein